MIKLKDLPKWAQNLVEENRKMVNTQKEALDRIEPAIQSLAEHKDPEKLSLPHRRVIVNVMRWDPEDFDRFLNPDPVVNEVEVTLGNGEKKMHRSETPAMSIEDRVARTFAPPHAFFYAEVNGILYQVYTEHGKPVEIRDDNHPEF